ncbi:hypothetical protein IEO21_07029 [Rhodonia placenta]|uniref:Uncharacterized protein n=1 Tax=Rhodonia placenta TaxID=104341 RepID=A0A8H7U019_9APHY|nr:hypothetical protein IEO21_07029 [Postia placenta]
MAIGNARNLTGIYEYRARIVHKSEIIPKGVETSLAQTVNRPGTLTRHASSPQAMIND